MFSLPKDRILILDGAMGTMIQSHGLTEEDYRNGLFTDCRKELAGNNECLNLSHPEIIKSIHQEYIAAGADIIETNTFSANAISQSEYDCGNYASEMAFEGARIAREAADEAQELASRIGLDRKVWVAGSMGPTSKSLSLSPDVADPAMRPYSFDQMKEAYREQAEALLKGGADLLLIETCFDALNVKAALAAISELCQSSDMQDSMLPPPVMISVSVGDRSGRTLTGQTLEAFHTAVSHCPVTAFGLNCSLGAAQMIPLLEDIDRWCSCAVSCYPNAGLPNEMGGYDQSPEEMAAQVRKMAEKGLVNIVGGCCGTTPEHIREISQAVRSIMPRPIREPDRQSRRLKVSGLETVTIDVAESNFTNIGERTNVAGSRKFARLISERKYDEALHIAARQIEDGAGIIDINMDDAMLDSTREMEKFVRHISNDPAVARASLMIDSSHWETILAGLKNAQGKCIVNSISLKDGEEAFIERAKAIRELGAAMVVMAFDEKGQAVTYERKIGICARAYRLLTEKAGVSPEDIIFDANILSVGTGIQEHSRYAVDFIEAVRWIKSNLPGALTSGGVSNLSFAFRGNNKVREAMHSAFLFHAVNAGLDMAIVNPGMLQVYENIDPELLECVEDVIFDRDRHATERLIAKASEIMEAENQSESAMKQKDSEKKHRTVSERLTDAIVKGDSDTLEADVMSAMEEYGEAVAVVEGPLMEGMEKVGRMFGEGKMFLPQVVKAAKVMKDAVEYLSPYMTQGATDTGRYKGKVVIATVRGDVHDIGKNITGIVLTCNGFDVHDLGVMVDKETILDEAARTDADIIAVSGLITPSLHQMEELCKEMSSRKMKTPLMIGGATTSALHTAVRLAPLYGHVFYGADASAAAVMAQRYMMDPEGFENEVKKEQEALRKLYYRKEPLSAEKAATDMDTAGTDGKQFTLPFPESSYPDVCPEDIDVTEISADCVLPYFDWRMFYAVWGVKYGSAVPEAAELMQLRTDAEEEIAMEDFKIMVSARFFMGYSYENTIFANVDGDEKAIPMMREEGGVKRSLCDFVIDKSSGKESPFGMFAISVRKRSKEHTQGCCCPACSNRYEDMIGRTVRQTLAEAASRWLEEQVRKSFPETSMKIIKPAAGYSSYPDHTLKKDILHMLGEHAEPHVCDGHCSHQHSEGLGISLTETYAMTPEASICGMIFIHPEARYPEIRHISVEQYEEYANRRGMDKETARLFLGHMLK